MAGKDGDEAPKKKKKKSTLGAAVVWALMAMLVIGLGGFGVTNFGGGQMAIGAVGSRRNW